MQNARDSFYMALRSRLVTVNAERTILLRGVARPGIVVEEAEAPGSVVSNDIFVLRWTGAGVDAELGTVMSAAQCEIFYSTCGTQSYGGLDRGRLLSAMDTELLTILQPSQTQKYNYSTSTPVSMQTNVFWDDPVQGPEVTQRDLLSRTVTVLVYSYEEQGE